MSWDEEVLQALAAVGIVGAVAFVGGVLVAGTMSTAAAVGPVPIAPVLHLGPFAFTDDADFASRVMVVEGAGADNGVVFGPSTTRPANPVLLSTGFEEGGAHYIWEYLWPYNDPGEVTIDAGAIADLWAQPANNVWYMEIANFDANPKTVILNDGAGHSAVFPLVSSVFFDVTQVVPS